MGIVARIGWGSALFGALGLGSVVDARAGMTVGQAAWSESRVEVCFAGKRQADLSRFGEDSRTFPTKAKVESATDEERKLIESAVRAEYGAAETGIEFTGFDDCVEGGGAKIYVYLGRGGPLGAANIGERMEIEKFWSYRDREGRQVLSPVYVKRAAMRPSYLYFRNLRGLRGESIRLSPADQLRLNVLHEFGHAAGLVHEDERPEANFSPNCLYQNSQSNYRVSGPTPLTPYDPASLMSYCFVGRLNDVAGLRYQVARPGRDPSALPSEGLPILAWPGVHLEDDLRTVERTEKADRIEFRIRPGLSAKDRRSLRCLYGTEHCAAGTE